MSTLFLPVLIIRGEIQHAHRSITCVESACNPHIVPARIEEALPMAPVRDSVIDQQVGNDLPAFARTVSDIFPDRTRPRSITGYPALDIAVAD
jgi:hypothetical protein